MFVPLNCYENFHRVDMIHHSNGCFVHHALSEEFTMIWKILLSNYEKHSAEA